MERVKLYIYGIRILLEGDGQPLEKLRKDFSWFISNDDPKEDYRIGINLTSRTDYSIIPEGASAVFSHPEFFMYEINGVRYFDYGGKGISLFDPEKKRISINSPDTELLHEITYLTVLSVAGESLERRGFFRVHGMGFSYKDRAALMLAPSGVGKTSLFIRLLKYPDLRVYGEDILLTDNRSRLFPFPVRIGVKSREELPEVTDEKFIYSIKRRKYGEKILLDTAAFGKRIAQPSDTKVILIARRWNSDTFRSGKASFFACLKTLIRDMGVGYGLPQLMEYMNLSLRPGRIMALALRSFKRFTAIVSLSLRAEAYYIYLGRDHLQNASGVIEIMEDIK